MLLKNSVEFLKVRNHCLLNLLEKCCTNTQLDLWNHRFDNLFDFFRVICFLRNYVGLNFEDSLDNERHLVASLLFFIFYNLVFLQYIQHKISDFFEYSWKLSLNQLLCHCSWRFKIKERQSNCFMQAEVGFVISPRDFFVLKPCLH